MRKLLIDYKKLLAARAMYSEIFAAGTRQKIAGSDDGQCLVFCRSFGGDNVYVGLNLSGEAKEVTFEIATGDSEGLTDVYSDKEVTVTGNEVTVMIPAARDGGTMILARKKEGGQLN